jgi:hypothetical protein
MLEKVFQKIVQLSQLPVFTGGKMEHALFVGLLIVIAICITIIIILVIKYLIEGIVSIWKQGCEIRLRSFDTKVKIEQEQTKQTEITKVRKSDFS